MNYALLKFEAGSLNAMWSILQGLYFIDEIKIDLKEPIPYTSITIQDINTAIECEFYLSLTMKSASVISRKIIQRPQMYVQVALIKAELYKAYSAHIQTYYNSSGINFVSGGTFLGVK